MAISIKTLAAFLFSISFIICIAETADAGRQQLSIGWSSAAGSIADRESGVLAVRLENMLGIPVKVIRLDRLDALERALEKGDIDLAIWPGYALLKDRVFFRRLGYIPLRKAYQKTWLYSIVPAFSSLSSTNTISGYGPEKRLKCYFLPPGATVSADLPLKQFDQVMDAVNGVADGRIHAIYISSNLLSIIEKYDPGLTQRVKVVDRIPIDSSLYIVAGHSISGVMAEKIKAVLAGAKPASRQAASAAAKTQAPASSVPSGGSADQAAPESSKPVDQKPSEALPLNIGGVVEKTFEPTAVGQKIPATRESRVIKSDIAGNAGNMNGRYVGRAIVNSATLLVAIITGLTMLLLGIKWFVRRRQALIAVCLPERFEACQLISLKECKVEVRSCAMVDDLRPGIDDDRLKNLIYQAGFRSGVRLISVIDSDTGRTRSYSMPWLKRNEIYPAIIWKLKEDNIPYDPRRDVITYMVWRLKGGKGMDILISILDKWDIERVQNSLGRMPDVAVCTEAALSVFVRCALDQAAALFYRISAEKAVMLFYHPSSGVFTRRLFAVAAVPSAMNERDSVFPGLFKDEFIQTVQLYERRFSRRLKTIYVSGYALRPKDGKRPSLFEQPVELPDGFGHLEIKALDLGHVLKDKTGLTGDFLFMPLAAGAFFAALKQTGGGYKHDSI